MQRYHSLKPSGLWLPIRDDSSHSRADWHADGNLDGLGDLHRDTVATDPSGLPVDSTPTVMLAR